MDISPTTTRPRGGTRAQHLAIGALATVLVLLGAYTLWNFLSALAWAGIFAIALWPLYRRALRRYGKDHSNLLLPAAFTLAVALIFIAPLGLVGMQLAREAHNASHWLRDAQENGIAMPDVLRRLPFGQTEVSAWWQDNLADPGSARELLQRATAGHMADYGREIGTQVLRRLTLFVFTLLTLFFLFKEGQCLTDQFRLAAYRGFGPGGERIGRQIIASIHGTVDGLVFVGVGEGAVLGVVYGIAGVPHATVLGAITAVAAMIPFAAPIVFGIAALILIAQGAMVWAIAVFCVGMAITFTADHFVRPALIGGATKLPFIWVLFGILGGVEAWGIIGLFLGPAIMAALIMLWREWACGSGRTYEELTGP